MSKSVPLHSIVKQDSEEFNASKINLQVAHTHLQNYTADATENKTKDERFRHSTK